MTHATTMSRNSCRFGLALFASFAHLLLKLVLCFTVVASLWLNAFGGRPGDSGAVGWVQAGPHMRLTQRNNHANISELLDNLLRGYDNSVRPDFGGPPATVEVDIMVRSMGPISEVDMTYSMDCYFRQSWVDKRLAFGGAQDTLALSVSMLGRIWKPDTYFYNGKQSYLHTITTPNKFVRIYQNGRVLYSSRLTIKAGCPMNLEDFPMDIQRCPLKFGSFGYTTNDIVYRWNKERPAVAIAEDMKLSQFDLVDCPAGNLTDIIHNAPPPRSSRDRSDSDKSSTTNSYISKKSNKSLTTFAAVGLAKDSVGGSKATRSQSTETYPASEYSMLMVNFHLQRHMGNFLIQVYGPCCLLVVLSWVSFWLNREATADRVSLGITTVLTMTFLGLEARTDLPKVPYPTALDFFVFLSFAFIFATILQFAVVHYFTKYGSGECYFIIEDTDSDSESELVAASKAPGSGFNVSTDSQIYEVIPLSMCEIPVRSAVCSRAGGQARRDTDKRRQPSGGCRVPCFGWQCLKRRPKHRVDFDACNEDDEEARLRASEDAATSRSPGRRRMSYYRREELEARRKGKRTPQYNSVSKIDRASRIVFPLLFFVINVFYWCAYLSRSSRILTSTTTNT